MFNTRTLSCHQVPVLGMIFQTLSISSWLFRLMKGLNSTENPMLYLLGEGWVDVKHVYNPMQRFIDFSVLSFKGACFHSQTCEAPEGWPGHCRDPLALLWVSRNGQHWTNASASGYRSEISLNSRSFTHFLWDLQNHFHSTVGAHPNRDRGEA